MKRISLAAATIAMLLVPSISEAGPITYVLQNYAADQNGSTLTGSVTTDGNLGTLTSADIVSWSWTISAPLGPPLTVSGSTIGSHAGANLLIATTQQLLLSEGGNLNPAEFFLRGPAAAEDSLAWVRDPSENVYYSYNSSASSYIWDTSNPGMGGTDPWVIGVSGASVPEPASVTLLGLGITGLLVRAWRRQAKRRHGE